MFFSISVCFSNDIQTDDAQKPVSIGTILHCTYIFWGLRTQTPPGLCPFTPLGDFRTPDPLLSRYTPCHYILDKGLFSPLHTTGLQCSLRLQLA